MITYKDLCIIATANDDFVEDVGLQQWFTERGLDLNDVVLKAAFQRALRMAMIHAGLDPKHFINRREMIPSPIDLPDKSQEMIDYLQGAWVDGFTIGYEASKKQP